MDWRLAIEKNGRALGQVIAGLFVLVGWVPGNAGNGARPTWVSRQARHHLKQILLTSEAALRRLIVLFMHVHAVTAKSRNNETRRLPDFSAFNERNGDRRLCFPLIDPRKPLVFLAQENTAVQFPLVGMPRIRVPGMALPVMSPPALSEADDVRPINDDPAALLRRLAALDHALKTLPKQASRLAKLMAKRATAPPGPKRVGPLRPGLPPGYPERGHHMAGDILRECQGLVRDYLAREHKAAPP